MTFIASSHHISSTDIPNQKCQCFFSNIFRLCYTQKAAPVAVAVAVGAFSSLLLYGFTARYSAERGRSSAWRQSAKEISSGSSDISFPGLLDWNSDTLTFRQTLLVLSCWLRTAPKARLRLGSQEPGTLLRHIKMRDGLAHKPMPVGNVHLKLLQH